MAELSEKEVKQRVAILKRFKELLAAQRERFQAYLDSLDRSRDAIENGSADELLRHVELEEKIVADIASIQKVIDPLESLYQRSRAGASRGKTAGAMPKDTEVPSLKAALAGLQNEAITRAARNKELLSHRMIELRAEIKSLRSNPYARRQNPGPSSQGLVDLRG